MAKLLIVDDDVFFNRALEQYFKKAGHEVVTAFAGEEALAKVESESPDLVILDVMMPDIDGFEVCRRLRADRRFSHLPILMLTAMTQISDKITGFEAGADDYITKPAHLPEVAARVEVLLRRITRPALKATSIGCMGAKGGVGTTTLAVNVAVAMAKQAEVILADLRPYYGTAGLLLGATVRANLINLLERDAETLSPDVLGMHLTPHRSGLRLLAGPQDSRRALTIPTTHARVIVEGLKTMANYLLLDLPPYPTAATEEILKHCDLALVMTEPEPSSLTAARAQMAFLKGLGFGPTNLGLVVVTRARSAVNLRIPEVENYLDHDVMVVIPPSPEACFDGVRLGVPIVLSHPEDLAAMAFEELAKRLLSGDLSLRRV
jgi:DNA-binding response OmpR family regulator